MDAFVTVLEARLAGMILLLFLPCFLFFHIKRGGGKRVTWCAEREIDGKFKTPHLYPESIVTINRALGLSKGSTTITLGLETVEKTLCVERS